VISWTGEFPFESDVGSLYLRAADFAVLPFDWGAALNNSSIAACVSHGLPLITTRRDPEDPAFSDRGNALLCPSRNSAALANAMLTLLNDKTLAGQLRTGAEELRRVHFSWETSVDRTISAFDKTQANRRGRDV
jgi:glycosyltransferase involved in cell wall biosynthesis